MNIQTEHIPSGSFKTGKKTSLIFQAFLGTCVGVALYDKSAEVGGLLHILLPEPISDIPPDFSEKYASTALPLLIKKLKKMGASEKNLKATIAGGALVGPISQMDINLDIGGRSTETALLILEKEKIEVIHSETGGFFTCTLELNMQTGKSLIKPAFENSTREIFDYSPPSKETILQTIDSLKPIPQAALKILRMIQNDKHDIKNITKELSKDQVLGGLTLKLCNSALFAGRVKIETLNDAVILLGETMLMRSVITAAVKSYFNQTGYQGYSLCKGGIFFHAVGCAVIAEKIALLTKKVNPQLAYTAGLLHDLGKVVLDQYIADVCPIFFRGVLHNGEESLTMEKKILGTTHCKAGAYLADKWQFSEALTQVVQFHHDPQKAETHNDIVSIVYIANLIMSRFNTELVLERVSTKDLKTALETLDLTLSDLPLLIDSIPLNAFKGIKKE
ncbi:MAG: HDOD domain-containing protein [Thermodesulfobacteriota bacterium]|nr:HDOD domain-containing protein [Thermodesulfobacteriota bacterium]